MQTGSRRTTPPRADLAAGALALLLVAPVTVAEPVGDALATVPPAPTPLDGVLPQAPDGPATPAVPDPSSLPAPGALLAAIPETGEPPRPRAPIRISSNADLCRRAPDGRWADTGVVNCDVADGTTVRPYLVAGWIFAATPEMGSGAGVVIEGVDRHVVLARNVFLGPAAGVQTGSPVTIPTPGVPRAPDPRDDPLRALAPTAAALLAIAPGAASVAQTATLPITTDGDSTQITLTKGILVRNAPNVHLHNNAFHGLGYGAILSGVAGTTVAGNTFVANGVGLLESTSRGVLHEANVFTSNVFSGGLVAASDDVRFRGNRFHGNALAGLELLATRGTLLEANQFVENAVFGLRAYRATNVHLWGNLFLANGDGAVFSGVDDARVEQGTFAGNHGSAVNVSGILDKPAGTLLVRASEFAGNAYGVHASGGFRRATVAESNFRGNAIAGIHAEGDRSIDARGNYWGAPNGPRANPDGIATGRGDAVEGRVIATPWRSEPHAGAGAPLAPAPHEVTELALREIFQAAPALAGAPLPRSHHVVLP